MKDLGHSQNLFRHLRSGNGFIKIEPSLQDSVDQFLPSCIGGSRPKSLFLPSLSEDEHLGRISLETQFMVQLHPAHFGEVIPFRIEEKVVKEAHGCFNSGRIGLPE